jgi:hypothetical protein
MPREYIFLLHFKKNIYNKNGRCKENEESKRDKKIKMKDTSIKRNKDY